VFTKCFYLMKYLYCYYRFPLFMNIALGNEKGYLIFGIINFLFVTLTIQCVKLYCAYFQRKF
jgi:hypothetical protein